MQFYSDILEFLYVPQKSSSENRDVFVGVFWGPVLYRWARLPDVRADALMLFACEGEGRSAVWLLLVYLRFAVHS